MALRGGGLGTQLLPWLTHVSSLLHPSPGTAPRFLLPLPGPGEQLLISGNDLAFRKRNPGHAKVAKMTLPPGLLETDLRLDSIPPLG